MNIPKFLAIKDQPDFRGILPLCELINAFFPISGKCVGEGRGAMELIN